MGNALLVAGLTALIFAAASGASAETESKKAEAEGAKTGPPAMAQAPAKAEAAANVEIGKPAPGFALTDQAGNEVTLADFAGKIVVLEWTNPECPVVQRHYKQHTMTRLAHEYGGKGVVWLAVNSTHTGHREKNQQWAEAQKITYPILDDAGGEVGRLYGAQTTPHMFVVDAKGMLAYAGAIDDNPRGEKEASLNHVNAALSSLLAGAKIENAQTKPYGCSVKYAPTAEASKSSSS